MVFDKDETVFYFFENEYVVREGYVTSELRTDSEDKDFYLHISGIYTPFRIWDMASTNENMIHIKQYDPDGVLSVLDVYVFKDKKECLNQANTLAQERIEYLKDVIDTNTSELWMQK